MRRGSACARNRSASTGGMMATKKAELCRIKRAPSKQRGRQVLPVGFDSRFRGHESDLAVRPVAEGFIDARPAPAE